MRSWLKCDVGHVFHIKEGDTESKDNVVFVKCPKCQSPKIVQVPDAVITAIQNQIQPPDRAQEVLTLLEYSPLLGCYHFRLGTLFVGVEEDGYMHT